MSRRGKSGEGASHRRLLTSTDDYALRAMLHIASLGDGATVRVADVARATGVPPEYLFKVLRRLRCRRLLVAQKGHHGGVQLARPARTITFADVLLAIAPLHRGRRGRTTRGARPNRLSGAYAALGDLFVAWASSKTLASR